MITKEEAMGWPTQAESAKRSDLSDDEDEEEIQWEAKDNKDNDDRDLKHLKLAFPAYNDGDDTLWWIKKSFLLYIRCMT